MKKTILLIALATALVGCKKQLHNYSDFEIEQARIEYALYDAKRVDISNSSKHCISEITVYTKDTPKAIEQCIKFGFVSNGVAYKGEDGYTQTFLASQLKTKSEKGNK